MADVDEKVKDDSVSKDRIPDLVRIGEIPSEYGQTLTTDIIDPATKSQTRARFTLNRVGGFLHSNSKITLGVVPQTNTSAFYPLQVGVGQLIQAAELRVGNKTVCAIDDFSSLHAYHSLFLTNENNKEREQYLSQRCINHGAYYTRGSDSSADGYGLELGRNPVVNGAGLIATELLPFQQHDGTSAQTISEAPIYSIYLSDLFPFLKFNQLPAFMIHDEIHVDLTFCDPLTTLAGVQQSKNMCVSGAAAANNLSYQIDLDELKMIYDSISYDGEVMRKYAEQNKELSFSYVDYRLAKRTQGNGGFDSFSFNIGGNGRLVSKVIAGCTPHSNYVSGSLLQGDGCSKAAVSVNADPLSINMTYNDRDEFPVDRSNYATIFHTTQQAEGQVPFVSRQEYSGEAPTVLTNGTFEGHDQRVDASGLLGNFGWVAVRPNRNERINNKGIDFQFDTNDLPAGNYTLRVYLELLKVATVKDGVFDCYFA
jgi:hypothetical protein